MDIKSNVTVNLSLMTNYQREIPSRNRKVLELWTLRYRSYIQRRWNSYSRGGGDWAPLKYREGSILRDTNTMFSAMTPAVNAPPGSINDFLSDNSGVIVGFGGSAAHPGGPSIMQIAVWHQEGAGKLPKREIIVPPDSQLQTQMREDLKRAHPNADSV